MHKLQELKEKFSFPINKPNIQYKHDGWFNYNDMLCIKRFIANPKIIVEVGSWTGNSTRCFLETYNTTIICVDTWLGSQEHADIDVLPHIYDIFIDNMWDYRDRVIPIKDYSVNGLQIIADHGILPDIIFIDASHEEEDVYNDLKTAHTLFPQATIIGHDYISEWQSVINGVNRYANEVGKRIVNCGVVWKIVNA